MPHKRSRYRARYRAVTGWSGHPGRPGRGYVMADDRKTHPRNPVLEDFRRLSVGAWIAIVVLLFLLVLAIVYVSSSGTSDLAAGVSGPGTIAMVFGVLFTMAVGIGLMGLIFF